MVYICFIDLRKAFDSVLHPALLFKFNLIKAGVSGKCLPLLKSMYINIGLRVKLDSSSISEVF